MSQDVKLEDRIESWQARIEAGARRVGKGKFGRVIRFARKPTPKEFRRTMLICGIGMILMGGIGFAIWYVMNNAVNDWIKPAWSWIRRGFGFGG